MKICNQCETINADSAQFCSKCGTRLGASQHGGFKRGREQRQQPQYQQPQYQQPQYQQPQYQQPQYQQPQYQQSQYQQRGTQQSYNSQNQLRSFGFSDAVRVCMKEKYASFEGRAKRAEYWYFAIFTVLISIAAVIVGGMLGALIADGPLGAIGLIWFMSVIVSLGLICPSISVFVRRLHDTGRSGWWFWLNLLPFPGIIILFIFCCIGSEERDNEYGPYVRYS